MGGLAEDQNYKDNLELDLMVFDFGSLMFCPEGISLLPLPPPQSD